MKRFVKFITFSLSVCLVFSFISCSAKTSQKVVLKTDVDTLSYAAGISSTQGLIQYLEQEGITKEYMNDFIQGFLEGARVNKADKKGYARTLGHGIGKTVALDLVENVNAQTFGQEDSVSTLNKDIVIAGFLAVLNKEELLLDESKAESVADSVMREIQNRKNEVYKIENLTFLEQNKTKEGVITLPSGLQYKVITEGTGPKPTAESTVVVDYVGTNIRGEEFDSSITRGEKAEFPLNQVIAGWTEGIQLMPVGSKYIFYVPYDLAYGEAAASEKIGPFATLIFEVDLHEIKK